MLKSGAYNYMVSVIVTDGCTEGFKEIDINGYAT
jgi:hypothetical protein